MKKLECIISELITENKIIAVHMETESLSYPVPVLLEERIFAERFFIFDNHSNYEKTRPYAAVTIDSDTGKLVSYENCTVCDFAKEAKIPLGTVIDYSIPGKLSFKESLKKKKEFSEVYNKIREISFAENLDENQINMIKKYKELHREIINEQIYKFYYFLSPGFYEWIDKVTE